MRSPLILPLTLIIAGVLAFMATTGILPPTVFRLWPVIFVILGIVGLISLSSEELMSDDKKPRKTSKPSAKTTAAPAKKAAVKKTSKAKTKSSSARKTSRKK